MKVMTAMQRDSYTEEDFVEKVENLGCQVEENPEEDTIMVYTTEDMPEKEIMEVVSNYYDVEKTLTLSDNMIELMKELWETIYHAKEKENVYDFLIEKQIKNAIRMIKIINPLIKYRNVEKGHVYFCEFGFGAKGETPGRIEALVIETLNDMCTVVPLGHYSITQKNSRCLRMKGGIDFIPEVPYESTTRKDILFLEQTITLSKNRIASGSLGCVTPLFLQSVYQSLRDSLPTAIVKEGTLSYGIRRIIEPAILKANVKTNSFEGLPRFLQLIRMSDGEIMTAAFRLSLTLKNLTWKTLLPAMQEQFPGKTQSQIKKDLTEEFKQWLGKCPILTEKYPHISLTQVLRIFAEEING
ncbi:MAG: hypothetical protein ACLU84_03130 [Clostridia bacterium]